MENSQIEPGFTVSATIGETPETRTQLSPDGDGYKVLWSTGDAISLLSGGGHLRYTLQEGGNGKVTATFVFAPLSGDSISGSIDEGISPTEFVGVYPFSEDIKLSKNGNDYVINTVIPTKQNYAEGSFGQNTAPMVAVTNYPANLTFKNAASVLVMPLKGDVKIMSAELTSKSHNIAGAATIITAEANNEWIPTLDVENGESQIVLSCGEGVQLKADEATKFYFVLAPGTYEANDLSIKFTDSHGNFFVTEISAENTFKRSKTRTFTEREFVAEGTEEVDLWVKAIAPAYINAERVIPSLNEVNIEQWVKNIANHNDDITVLVERIMLASSQGNYKKVYEILGGIPGFTKETKTFEVTGMAKEKVVYNIVDYVDQKLQEVYAIENVDEFLTYINKNGLDRYAAEFGTIRSWLNKIGVNGNDVTLTEEEKLAMKRKKAEESIKDEIDELQKLLKTIPSNLTEQVNANINKANEFLASTATISDEEFKDKFNDFTLSRIKKGIISSHYSGYSGSLKWIEFNVSDTLGNLGNNIAENSLLADVIDMNIITYLKNNAENKESLTYRLLSQIFDNEKFLTSIKETLADIITELQTNLDNQTNVTNKAEAIEYFKGETIVAAQNNAFYLLGVAIKDANTENLNNLNKGPWGIFKWILGRNETVNFFDKYGITEVHTALEKMCTIIENLISYDMVGETVYPIDKESYVEGEHWWVLEYDPEF